MQTSSLQPVIQFYTGPMNYSCSLNHTCPTLSRSHPHPTPLTTIPTAYATLGQTFSSYTFTLLVHQPFHNPTFRALSSDD